MANDPNGGTYPVGTLIQLIPQEAMIKRHKGFNAKTSDWEFFFLTTDATGTTTAGVMGRAYPGAGCSIGPSFTWGFVAAKHAAGLGNSGV